MDKISLVCAMLLLCITSYSQNNIKGRITDQDNLPLVGANIFVQDLNRGTITDENGNYELTNLPNGKIQIQFSYIGHINRIESIILNGTIIERNIVLRMTSIESEEIVVTGGYNSTQHENAVKIDVLKLNFPGIKSTPNFTEILTKVPGVDMISKGSGVSKPVIRGLSMNEILVLNNGIRFENYQYSSHHPLGIDEFGISNVEIIKGPASLLYGSDAIGGVINFIKEKPALSNSISGDYNLQMFSNSLGMSNNFGIKGASDKFFGGIRIGHKTNSDYLQGGGDYVPNSRSNEYSIKTQTGYSIKTGTFKIFYDYSKQNLGLVEDEAVEQITERSRLTEIYYQQLITHLLSSQNKLYLGKIKLDVNSSFQSTELSHIGDVDVVEIQMRLATLTYETKLHLPSNEKSEYIIGFQGINQLNNNLYERETKLLPDAIINNYSGYLLLQHNFFKKIRLQTGIRYDYKSIRSETIGAIQDSNSYRAALDKNYNSFSGSLGATYNITELLLLRANIASAYRTPNLAELSSKGQHETRFEVGNQYLIPEKAYEADLSLHYHSGNFAFDASGFYNFINNYIFISPINDTTENGIGIYNYLQGNSKLFGGETGFHFHPANLKWISIEATFSTVIGKQLNGNFLPFIPANKLNFEIGAKKEKLAFLQNIYLTINSSSAFIQENSAPDETATNDYTLIDINLSGNIKAGKQLLNITVSANNIFDNKYIDHLSTLKEVNLFNPGRNFTLSLKIPFRLGISKSKRNI